MGKSLSFLQGGFEFGYPISFFGFDITPVFGFEFDLGFRFSISLRFSISNSLFDLDFRFRFSIPFSISISFFDLDSRFRVSIRVFGFDFDFQLRL